MKHQEFKNRDAYARRYGELVAENVAMEQRIHRLVRDYNRVAKNSAIWKTSMRMWWRNWKIRRPISRNCITAIPTSATLTSRKGVRPTTSETFLPNCEARTQT